MFVANASQAGITPGGRLTTESGVAISTTDRISQGTIYYCPYLTDFVRLYNGTGVQDYQSLQLSLALSGLTAGKNYDVFVYDNAGALTLELGAAWTNDTTRADAVAFYIALGAYVKNSDPTRLWLGTMRATGTGTTEDSSGVTGTTNVGGKRFLWNYYNQVPLWMRVIDTTDSYSYATATIRQARATAGNKVEFVTGLAGTKATARVSASVALDSNSARAARVGVGLDTTSAFSSALNSGAYCPTASATIFPLLAVYSGYPGLGYHYLSWNEAGADGTCVFYGDGGALAFQSGLEAELLG